MRTAVAMILLTLASAADSRAQDGALAMHPAAPLRGERVEVTYQPAAAFAGLGELRLRG